MNPIKKTEVVAFIENELCKEMRDFTINETESGEDGNTYVVVCARPFNNEKKFPEIIIFGAENQDVTDVLNVKEDVARIRSFLENCITHIEAEELYVIVD